VARTHTANPTAPARVCTEPPTTAAEHQEVLFEGGGAAYLVDVPSSSSRSAVNFQALVAAKATGICEARLGRTTLKTFRMAAEMKGETLDNNVYMGRQRKRPMSTKKQKFLVGKMLGQLEKIEDDQKNTVYEMISKRTSELPQQEQEALLPFVTDLESALRALIDEDAGATEVRYHRPHPLSLYLFRAHCRSLCLTWLATYPCLQKRAKAPSANTAAAAPTRILRKIEKSAEEVAAERGRASDRLAQAKDDDLSFQERAQAKRDEYRIQTTRAELEAKAEGKRADELREIREQALSKVDDKEDDKNEAEEEEEEEEEPDWDEEDSDEDWDESDDDFGADEEFDEGGFDASAMSANLLAALGLDNSNAAKLETEWVAPTQSGLQNSNALV